MHQIIGLLITALLVLPCVAVAQTENSSAPPPAPEKSLLSAPSNDPANPLEIEKRRAQKIGEGLYKLGEVMIKEQEQIISFPASINMNQGLLEYALVAEKGKLHESLLKTTVEPIDLQTALLLLGYKPATTHLNKQGEDRIPEGSPVDIFVEWTADDKTQKAPIETWIINKKTSAPMNADGWLFTGSTFFNGIFMAQQERSLVAIYHDPNAIIDNPSPDGNNDEIWFVNEDKTPPPGTQVTVSIQKRPVPEQK